MCFCPFNCQFPQPKSSHWFRSGFGGKARGSFKKHAFKSKLGGGQLQELAHGRLAAFLVHLAVHAQFRVGGQAVGGEGIEVALVAVFVDAQVQRASEVRDAETFGVLQVTLYLGRYTWARPEPTPSVPQNAGSSATTHSPRGRSRQQRPAGACAGTCPIRCP